MKPKTFATLASLVLLMTALTLYAANIASAGITDGPVAAGQSTEPEEVTFSTGGINLGRGQTASIIAILLPGSNLRDQEPAQVDFLFHDWNGDVVAKETRTLLPGQASSLDVRGIIAIRLVPSVRVLLDPSDPRVDRVTTTLVVSDTTSGKAQFAITCRKSGGIHEY